MPRLSSTPFAGKTMRLAQWSINGRFLSQPATGVQRYAEEIVRALDQLLAEQNGEGERLKLELLCPPGSRELRGLKSISCMCVGHGGGHLWEQGILPQYVKGGLLSLGNTGPLAISRQIVCIHDVNPRLFPRSYSKPFRLFYYALLPAIGRRVAAIATVSHYSASQLQYFGIAPASKITVIPNGHEHIERWEPNHSQATREASGLNTIVLIGSPAPHKNIALMLRLAGGLGRQGLKLAIAGALDTKVFKIEGRETANLSAASPPNPGEGVIWLGRVSDAELAALLKDSLCLVFPSYVEGFGLPVLEAMALGCPVIVSDRASIPEICGRAALYASPDDDHGWLENIMRLQTDACLRRDLAEKGQARAKSFSWRQSAQLYIRLINQLEGF
jgi:glycosyltransferase involved in cell wall biosynthesis